MKKKPIWDPREKDSQKLLVQVDKRIDSIHKGLRALYMGSDEVTADLIHGVRKQVFYLREVLFDLLFDEKPAEKILEGRK